LLHFFFWILHFLNHKLHLIWLEWYHGFTGNNCMAVRDFEPKNGGAKSNWCQIITVATVPPVFFANSSSG
jgi:hypothetical protein